MIEDRIADVIVVGTILTIIVLKITGIIKLSWLVLLAPVWVLLCFGTILSFFIGIMFIISIYNRIYEFLELTSNK